MGNFVLLIDKSVLGGGGASGDIGIVVLGNLLVALFGGFSTSALDGLTDVLSGVLGCLLVATKNVLILKHAYLDGLHNELIGGCL